jgi:hypothetical protein
VRRFRGFVLAAAFVAMGVARFREVHEVRLDGYDAFTLPGFDAYVYVAMAEAPAFFTLPPWGHRILVPWLVHVLPGGPVTAWRWLGYAALVACGPRLFAFRRRLGCGEKTSLIAVAAFALSGPLESAVSYPFLVEPVTLCLLLGLLLALESGAGAGLLGLLAVLAVLSKEVALVFLPVIFFARRDRDGARKAFATAVAAIVPALLATAVLRLWWAPVTPTAQVAGSDVLWLAAYRLLDRFPDWWRWAFLGGFTPLAALGALLPESRPFLRRYAWLLAVTWALPFAASVYTAEPSVPFFGEDIPRLLLYALPVTLPLALAVLERALGRVRSAAAPVAPPRAATAVACAGFALAVALLPLLLQDRYRRADLRGPRDGRLVLTFCRESLGQAESTAAGRSVDMAPERRSFLPGKSYPQLASQMRWFLRAGWGRQPAYGNEPVVSQAASASLVIPVFVPEDLNLNLIGSAAQPRHVTVFVNGRGVGEMDLADALSRQRLVLPGGALFRGDNDLRFESAAPGFRLHELRVRAAR